MGSGTEIALGLVHNNSMQRAALRTAADAERYSFEVEVRRFKDVFDGSRGE
jgi:hypothetical protein